MKWIGQTTDKNKLDRQTKLTRQSTDKTYQSPIKTHHSDSDKTRRARTKPITNKMQPTHQTLTNYYWNEAVRQNRSDPDKTKSLSQKKNGKSDKTYHLNSKKTSRNQTKQTPREKNQTKCIRLRQNILLKHASESSKMDQTQTKPNSKKMSWNWTKQNQTKHVRLGQNVTKACIRV